MAVKEKPEKHESDEKIVEIELERLREILITIRNIENQFKKVVK